MEFRRFETERLFIRPTLESDADLILNLYNSPKFIRYIGDRNVRSIREAKEYIREKMISQLERLGFSNYTLIRKLDGKKIGTCGLYDREGLDGIDIGFAFLPEFEKQGYAFEASVRVKNAAFKEFNLKRLSAITSKDNHDSQRLLKKLGFKESGVTNLPNDSEELLVFSRYNNGTD